MPGSSFYLRNINPKVMSLLKKEAALQNISVNSLILGRLYRFLGPQSEQSKYHELDALAGTWSNEDAKAFSDNIKLLEKCEKMQ